MNTAKKQRKPNSKTTVDQVEKMNDLLEGTFRNLDGSNARGDKQIETLGEEYERQIGLPEKKPSTTICSYVPLPVYGELHQQWPHHHAPRKFWRSGS